ncbi:MAG TPA: response regulator transcription factor [Steroidobacteraceae bacterium]|jgi:two-component system OmpR family response regulator|nr:response regulator transcription factor [Steroidobacteraceae bacterium]
MRVLLIEDDTETGDYVLHALAEDGHEAAVVHNGREGLQLALGERWDLLIVDRMLPELDGIELVETVRRGGRSTAVLLLTTLGGVDDRVRGLNAGADDYLVKPFAMSELLARVAALGRRATFTPVQTSLRFADLEMDLLRRTVTRGGEQVELLPREFRLLEYLMKHAEQVVTRSMLLEHVWDVHFDPHTSVVETHISRLRGKIDRGNANPLIHTVRGSGYSLRAAR